MTDDQDAAQSGGAMKLSDFISEDKAEETVEAVEIVESEEKEPEDVDEGETGENGTGEPEGEEEKPRKPIQDRFDKLTAEKHEARREADYWRGVAEGRTKPTEEPQAEQPEDTLTKPDPADFEFGEADPGYIDAITDWKVDTKLAERDRKAQADRQRETIETAVQQLEKGYSERVTAAKAELPDYDEVVTKPAARGEWPLPALVALAAKESAVGPKVLHHLATHLDEAIAVSSLSPIEQAVAFGRLEARFLEAPDVKPNKVTSAPPPPSSRTRGSGGQFEDSERSMYRKMLKEFR